jgi:hypothetical protein
MKSLSKKAQRAIEVMNDGGYWREQLETGFHGREQFHTRLRDKQGHVVKGFGFQTKTELENAGLLRWRETARSSSWGREWILKEVSIDHAA